MSDIFGDDKGYATFLNVANPTVQQVTYWSALLQYVTRWIQTYCYNQRFVQSTYTEFANPRSVDYIICKQRPVISITSMYYDPEMPLWGQAPGAFAAGTLQVAGQDYALKLDYNDFDIGALVSRSGLVYLLSGQGQGRFVSVGRRLETALEDNQGTIKLTYVAGWQQLPADLILATYILARQLEISARRAGFWNAAEGTKYYNYSLSDVLGREFTAQRILRKYRGMGVDFA